MNERGLAEFRRKAPLIDVEDLADMLRFDMLSEGTRERASSIWVVGSFVAPDSDLDTGEAPSDLDVFVVLPDWELPIADTSMAMMAPQADTPSLYDHYPETYVWNSKDTPERSWDCSAEEAWEQLPEHARQTLVRSTEKYFFATEEDVEEDRRRSYELSIATARALQHGIEDIPALEVWSEGQESDV